MGRIIFDVSYTRLQQGSVGITRTVRKLGAALSALAASRGLDFVSVAFHPSGFRSVAAAIDARQAAPSPGWLMKIATGTSKPVIERALSLPWTIVGPLWAQASGLTFARAAANAVPLTFRTGDVLLLFDGSWNYPVWRIAQLARAQGARVVPLVHDLMPVQAPQFCVPWVRSAFKQWLRQAITGSDAMFCNSASTLAELRSYAAVHGLLLPPASHIRLGMDLGNVTTGPVRDSLRAFKEEGPFYTTIGTLEPKKNHTVLLDAFERLWNAGQSHRLLVLGRATRECAQVVSRLEALSRSPGRVCWISDSTDSELAFAMRSSQAVVLPSLFEGFGLPLVEARAVGCPVIASDLPAFRELADEGVCLFPASSPGRLAQLLHDHAAGDLPLSRTPMRLFSWEDTARSCLEQLSELIGMPMSTALLNPALRPF